MNLHYRTETGGVFDDEDIIGMIIYLISTGANKKEIIEFDESDAWKSIVASFPFGD